MSRRLAVVGDGPRLTRPVGQEVGEKTAKALGKLGIVTVGDLLRHYPRRYERRGELTDLADLRLGEHVTVVARVVSVSARRVRSGFVVNVVITDGRGRLTVTFFPRQQRVVDYYERQFRPGTTGWFSGTVSAFRGTRQLTHPAYEPFDPGDSARALAELDWPIPVYPASAAISSPRIRTAARVVVESLAAEDVPDPLPEDYRRAHHLMSAVEALRAVHVPHTDRDWQEGQRRLRHDEAFVLQVALAQRRASALAEPATARPLRDGGVLAAFDARLPFDLTAGQREVGGTVAHELAGTVPMQRLLQGEVGAGKTVVALRAMLQVVDAGGQAALLAPTEVLAHQHARSVRALMGPLAEAGMLGGAEHATRVELLTGSMPSAARRRSLAAIASGQAGVVIGTHALIQEAVQFADLGLVVVDEQHRFGVEQRDALRAKAAAPPHLLVMTATPIPRTVAMTVFGDLEVSTLRELPVGRAGVQTSVVPADRTAWLARLWLRVREEIDRGGRAYVVCPRITATEQEEDMADVVEDDVLVAAGAPAERPERRLASVDETAARLRALPALEGVAVGELHGRMTSEEKEAAMAAFAAGEVPVLVSTTVVEVGVDVPEATAMVVLDAERFGLSQLHQLRGRVGRGTTRGLCAAVTAAEPGSPAWERLSVFAGTDDGFTLADADLRLRREGDVLGSSQSGRSGSLRMLRIGRDADVIAAARTAARALVEGDPALDHHPALAEAIADRLDEESAEFLQRA